MCSEMLKGNRSRDNTVAHEEALHDYLRERPSLLLVTLDLAEDYWRKRQEPARRSA